MVGEGRGQGKSILVNENSVCRGPEQGRAEPVHRLERVSVRLGHGVVKARPGDVDGGVRGVPSAKPLVRCKQGRAEMIIGAF